jgi:hypothetical protein
VQRIRDLVPDRAEKMLDTYEEHYERLFSEHPFAMSERSHRLVGSILNNATIEGILELK